MAEPVRNKTEILARLRGAHAELSALGVTDIGLFGSFVTGRQRETSDVDLLVDFAPDLHTFDNFMDLCFLLEDLLGRRVELVTRQALSPHLAPRILAEVERVAPAA